MDFPEPVMSIVVEPAQTVDQDKLGLALSRLADEDPTFAIRTDPETGETLMAGMGELHLQVLVENLKTDHGVAVHTGEPKVAQRETITAAVTSYRYRPSKQTGGPGMFAEVVVNVEPAASTEVGALEFQDLTKGGSVPSSFVSAFQWESRSRSSMAQPTQTTRLNRRFVWRLPMSCEMCCLRQHRSCSSRSWP